ncbi:hypothetical protein D3C87_1020190 [compost metagenome]
MSDQLEPTLLHFPLRDPVPSNEVLILRDLEVAGVGALRRVQLEKIRNSKKLILWTYEELIPEDVRGIYQEELLRSLHWLRPFKTESGPAFDLHQEHLRMFAALFPMTKKYLGLTAEKMAEEYLQEMTWSSWLLQDHWRYFAGFLRQKFPTNKEVQELVQWEWVHAWLETQAFQASGLGDLGQAVVNPSLQYISLSHAHALLGRTPGLYAFVFSEQSEKIIEKTLDVYEAELLDLLMEDRKFNPAQITEMLALTSELEPKLTQAQWEMKLQGLKDSAIIIEVTKESQRTF